MEPSDDLVRVTLHDSVLTVTLNRPDNHNAMSPAMVAALTAVFQNLPQRKEVRVVVLTGNGRSFCAGADLAFMRAAADYTFDQNLADGEAIFDLMHAIDACPQPVVGRHQRRRHRRRHGAGELLRRCRRGRQGLSSALARCAWGWFRPSFRPLCWPRSGWAMAVNFSSPASALTPCARSASGWCSTLWPRTRWTRKVEECVTQLLQGAPGAQAAAKMLIRQVAYQPPAAMRDFTARLIAARRADAEGREGMSAFLEKRRPRLANFSQERDRMSESQTIAAVAQPATRASLAADLRVLGVQPGMTLLVHSSLSALGWVCGGPVAVIQALQDALTPAGALVMPTHTSEYL
jgi:methylglutaconyl-CoA hydratase